MGPGHSGNRGGRFARLAARAPRLLRKALESHQVAYPFVHRTAKVLIQQRAVDVALVGLDDRIGFELVGGHRHRPTPLFPSAPDAGVATSAP